jgi:hypothetical protein
LDSLFCSWLIFACEQLQHLKEIMKPLMELSASLDTYVPKSADLFRAPSATSQDNLIENGKPKNFEKLQTPKVISEKERDQREDQHLGPLITRIYFLKNQLKIKFDSKTKIWTSRVIFWITFKF